MHARIAVLLIAFTATIHAGTVAGQEWVEITPASGPAPTPRTLSAAIYDPIAHAMVVFGGEDAVGRSNEVWTFDLATNTWTDLTPALGSAPAPRRTPATVYDIANHQLLTFSGQGTGGVFFNDTWGFDLTTHVWTEFSPPAPIPTIRYGVATCYDPVAMTQVTFAGFTFQGRFDDTWRFDPVTDAWSDVSPVSGSPLERCLHVACYDGLDRLMIMYGGQNGGPLGDIWAFDLVTETWTELTPAAGPDPRWFSTLEYDALNHRATMFSGNRSALGKANDVWVFDLTANDWFELTPAGTPPLPRDGAASVYVQSEDRMVIFGGSPASGHLNDVWTLNNLSDTPTGIASDNVPRDGAILYQNFPNPFNPSTVIAYDLTAPGQATLTIFDVEGQKVRDLFNGMRTAGPHSISWDGRNDAGNTVASGVYFYRLQIGSVLQVRKMLLVK